MIEKNDKKTEGRCFECEGVTELVEFDLKKRSKIMYCKNCSLYHFYKRDFLSRWKLSKASKNY